MRLTIVIAALVVSSPTLAQELDLDFDNFDFEDSADAIEASPANSLELSVVVGISYAGVGVLDESWAAQINVANEHNLGTLGYLEWAGSASFGDDVNLDLTRIQLQNSAGDLSWKLGKYRIGWGEIEGVPVLDVLNSALSFGSGLQSDELPGQWFAGLDYFASAVTISSFAGIAPEVAHVIQTAQSTDLEFGIKAEIPTNSGSFSLYAAQLVPQSGVVNVSPDTSHAAPYLLTGISANHSIGSMLFEVDVAGKFGLQRSTELELSEHNRVDAALGVEYAASNTLQITAAVVGQHWLQQTQYYVLPGDYLSPQTTANYILGVSDTFMDGDLSVSANMLGALDNSVSVTAISADYSYSEKLEFGASAMWMGAETGNLLEEMDGFTQYGITSTFHF